MFIQNNVNQLPPLARMGIGSLPPMNRREAIKQIFSLDIPYLATFPQLDSKDGFLEELQRGELPILWEVFLKEAKARKIDWIKIQWPGPYSLRSLPKEGRADGEKKYLERLKALLSAFSGHFKHIIFFLDEPCLKAREGLKSYSPIFWEKLQKTLFILKSQEVCPGLHCCGDAPWKDIFDLPVDILSFDVELSLKALLEQGAGLREFHRRGGRLAFGIVPTKITAKWHPERICEEFIKNIWQALGPKLGGEVLARSLLSPACGLGMRSVGESQLVFNELKHVQKILLERLKK